MQPLLNLAYLSPFATITLRLFPRPFRLQPPKNHGTRCTLCQQPLFPNGPPGSIADPIRPSARSGSGDGRIGKANKGTITVEPLLHGAIGPETKLSTCKVCAEYLSTDQ